VNRIWTETSSLSIGHYALLMGWQHFSVTMYLTRSS